MEISVVVPVYNEEEMLAGCLDAILAQRPPFSEVIVVDNNSSDGTRRVLRRYAGRVRVVAEPRQGVQFARTTGMDAASGDVIARVDADTRLPAGWTHRVAAALADPAVAAVTGPVRYYDIAAPRVVAAADLLLRGAWVLSEAGRLDWVFGANMAVRAAAWRAVRPRLCHDPGVHEDQDLGMHLYGAGARIVFDRSVVARTSSRRILDPFPEFRAYLRMTERGYASHRGVARRCSRQRAWLTSRALFLLYRPLRALHHRGTRNAPVRPRKNPMSGDTG